MRFANKYKKTSRPMGRYELIGNKSKTDKKKPSHVRSVYARYIATFLVTLLVIGVIAVAYTGDETYPDYYEDVCKCCANDTIYTSITIPRGQSIMDSIPAGPILEGYRFVHWSSTRSGVAFDFGQNLYQDMAIYAIWLPYHNDEDLYQDYDTYYQYEHYTEEYGYYEYSQSYQEYDHYNHSYEYPQYEYPNESYHQYDHYSLGYDSYYSFEYVNQDNINNNYEYHTRGYNDNYAYSPQYQQLYDDHDHYDLENGYQHNAYLYDAYYAYDYYAPEHNYYYENEDTNQYYYQNDYIYYAPYYESDDEIIENYDCCHIGNNTYYYHEYGFHQQAGYIMQYEYYDIYASDEDTITISFVWNRGATQVTDANIELDYRGNVTVSEDIDYIVILDGNYIHVRFFIELENVYINIEDSTWTYLITTQYEENEVYDEYGYLLHTDITSHTMVTISHDILSRNSGFIGFTPFVSGMPGGFSLNVLAAPFDNQAWLDAVGNNVAGNNVVVAIPQNVTLPGLINISGNRHVIITSYGTNLNSSLINHTAPPTTFSITHAGTAGRHFNVSSTVGANTTLTISHVIIDGDVVFPSATPAARGGISVGANAYFYMLPGSVIQHNRAVSGGGVHVTVNNAATRFTMLGGIIQNNVATSTTATGSGGGGVHLNGSTFYMRHGDIINNRSLSNATNNNGGGGGIIISGGTVLMPTMFVMDDDPLTPGAGVRNITGNVASQGGGVHVAGTNTIFTMDGNSNITNNTTPEAGGASGIGVRISSGRFIMEGGTISNNLRPAGVTSGFNGGGVHLSTTLSRFYLNGGTISGHTVTTSGGGVHVSAGAYFEMNSGIITGNTATSTAVNAGGGGVSVLAANSRFEFNGGTIQNNHAAVNGGGILLSETTSMNPLPLPTGVYFHFPQLSVSSAAVFANNTAGRGSFTPPGNAATATEIAHTASSGGYLHALNNLDISFFYMTSDWLKLNGIITTTSVQRVIIHPTGSLVTPGIVGTDYNLIIQDPGDGYTITTVSILGDGSASHTISVPDGRTVTLLAAPGADIVLRMPVPGSPNTPNQAPWATTHPSLLRHFTLNNANLTIGDVGFGNLILDGNVRYLPEGNTGTRGGIAIGGSSVLTLQVGGAIYNNRAATGGGVSVSGTTAVFNMSGGSITDNESSGLSVGGNSGGGVSLVGSGSTFNMTGGTISGNTANINGGGIALTANNTHFYMHAGTIDGNTANNDMAGGGGIHVSGAASRVNILGGTISNNHSGGNGGGIFATVFTMIDPIPLPTGAYFHYPQLIVSASAIFTGNTSVGGSNTPPANATTATQITNAAQRSGGFSHPLNNLDINFFFSSADWARLDRLISNAAGPTTIIIHPTGAGVAPGLSGTTYNFVITDPGDGSLITTISLQGAATAHSINVSRSITIAAAAGSDIVIRMPAPGAPNTPNQTPWVTARDTLERHFLVSSANLTLGGGAGFGNLTLDGNANQNSSNRGGISLGVAAGLIIQSGGVIYNNRADNGGAVSLLFASSNLNMTGGSISHNYATNGGGVALSANGSTFVMTGGSITGNSAVNSGGGVQVAVTGGSNLFTFNSGAISNNSAANGGGVHVATTTNVDPLPIGTHFPQIAVSSSAIFTGNIATGGAFEPPANADTNTNIAVTAQVSGGFWHPLNNHDVNFFRVLGSDWRRLNEAINATTASNIIIHPTGTTGVTDGLVGSTYNLIITDPGDGYTITTTQLWSNVSTHSITITSRTVAISAGSGADIVIRMPAPCASNTPDQIPWISSTEVMGRHFLIRHNGNLTLHGGTGTLTLDGNSHLVPVTMHGVRGGVELGGGAGNAGNGGSFVLNTGGIIYNNRAIGNSYVTGGGGGVNVMNAQNFPAGGTNYPSTLDFRMYGGYIIGNYASRRGGGLSLDSMSGGRVNFVMTGGEISDNRSSYRGGGVSVCCGVRTWLYDGYIHNNIAINGGGMFIGEFTAPYNHIAIHGGEIFENIATHNGGGLHTGNLAGNRITMTGGHIHNNYAVSVYDNLGNGGGVFHHAGRLFLFGGKINDNHASGSGGGLYSTDDLARNQIGEFIMDVNRPMMRNLNTLGASGTGNVPMPGQPVEVPNPNYPNGYLEINNNRARFNGGGASLMTRSEFDEFNIPFAICDLVEINGNTAGIYGGGIFLGNETRRVYMSGGSIANNGHPEQVYTNTGTTTDPIRTLVNIRTRNGGGLYMNDGMFTLYGGYITGNAALGHYTLDPSNNQIWNGGYGGGVHMGTNASTFIIADYVPFGGGAPVPGIINFTNNIARVGGAVHYYHGTWSYTTNTGPVNFIGNIAAQRGGALAITNNRTLNINNLWTFSTNEAGQYGGAIYLNNSTLNMSGGLIGGIQNSVAGNTAIRGAGVYAGNGTVFNMTGGTIRLNFASHTGGGIATHDGRTIFNMHDGLIDNNNAIYGGGIGMMSGSTANITPQGGGQPVIRGNTATYGAGVHVYGVENRAIVPSAFHGASTLTMNGGTIGGTSAADANIATQSGGGIYIAASTISTVGAGRQTRNTVTLNSGSTVTWNIANATGSTSIDGGGGGIYVTDNGQLNATGAHITNNAAPNGMGGGIFSEIHEYLNPLVNVAPAIPAALRAYRNLNLVSINFSGNTSNAMHAPPINANTTTLPHILFNTTSPAVPPGSLHPLNNNDINYAGAVPETDFYFHKTNPIVNVPNPILLPGAQFILVRYNGTGTPPVGMVTQSMIGSGASQWTQVGGTHTSTNVTSDPMVFTMIRYRYYHIIETSPPSGFQLPLGQWRVFYGGGATPLTITPIGDGMQMATIWGPIIMQDASGEDINVRMIGNMPDFELPLTGSIGIIGYTITGSIITVFALAILGTVVIVKKRRKVVIK